MTERRARALDVLSLVDVMMVILFALVTTQEADLDHETARGAASARQVKRLQAKVVELEERLAEVRQGDVAQSAQMRAQLNDVQRKFGELLSTHLKLKRERWPDGPEAFRRDNVLEKLLDQNVVLEIEITGQPSPEGVINHCCFRHGPRKPEWQSCGQVPGLSTKRKRWFDEGADGLLTALRATGGGHQVTIIRQDISASYIIGTELEETIRSRFSTHTLYNDGVQAIPVRCGTIEGKAP